MSAICGYVGEAPPGTLSALLDAVSYRGDTNDVVELPGVGLATRFWGGRPGKSPGIFRQGETLAACAGTLVPRSDDPAAELARRLLGNDTADLDGAFGAAVWDGATRRLRLARDPFGVRSLYWCRHAGTFWFASEVKQLLAIPGLPVEPDPVAIHKYLTFSFVPGEDLPIQGLFRLLPRRIATWNGTDLSVAPYFQLREEFDPRFDDTKTAVREIRRLARAAVEKRLTGEAEVALFLSGGLDSSAVGLWLKEAGAKARAFTLDFGEKSVEREPAAAVAAHLGFPLETLPVDGTAVAGIFDELVHRLDLPFGDPVTGPQLLLGRAARAAGLSVVFNGEGGDQLFGGWTSKPMVAAAIYGDLYDDQSREQQYLASYHRFYGLEDRLYTDDFRAAVGPPGQRRAHLTPYLQTERASTFLNRIRLADISLKGSQNILPRAERMAGAVGLDLRCPFFDRELAEASFALPPQLKLRGATEKYVLKVALRRHLPPEIVWRRKFGMSVPVTDWALGPLAPLLDDLLGEAAVTRRGLFRADWIAKLRRGENEPDETRRRRVGERLWTLAILEGWMRRFVDRRGKP